ncbi:MAG: Uma2 family endonuclease [Oscillatoria sp. PMC 1051.18]|nr:Uma2 family endonuclease [Oscillatoria sp. PMC 1050.18]MEC5030646.1 Uma2 family endonuclease [Oscillatoria sp. PMC 1051.18]
MDFVNQLQKKQETFIPPLENGSRLTRAEFERRYQAMPEVKKAELIEGKVYMPSPLRFNSHANPHFLLIAWLGVYVAATPGVKGGDNATVRLDLDNEPQPDALLRIESGQSQISDDDYVENAPELIAEIAASSASYDSHEKLIVYRRNLVQEYLVWRVYDRALDWYQLRQEEYIKLEPDVSGVIRSQVFPGLWLQVPALLAGDLATVLNLAQQGLASSEHAAFVKKLT